MSDNITTPYGVLGTRSIDGVEIPLNMIVDGTGAEIMTQLVAQQATMITLLQQMLAALQGQTPLGDVTLSNLLATAGTVWTSTIGDAASGAVLTAGSTDGTPLTVVNGQVTGTFTNATANPVDVAITITQTKGGQSQTTNFVVTVSSATGSFTPSLDHSDARNSQYL